ncbi:MAG: M20/M25/M40 family metallo-hydrolase [Candidatus Bathyarchaeia archaeon]
MTESLKEIYRYIDENADRFVEDLRRLCRQPSVSARHEGIEECAELIKAMMEDVGVEARIIPTEGHPIVLGEQRFPGATRTLGFYNHYDVQPPEPLGEWESPPFSADVREGRIFARGAADNKGNFMARLKAVEAVKETVGRARADVKFLLEGEEEIGSPHLGAFVKANMGALRADGYNWEGGGVDERGRPVVNLGNKGLLYVELRAEGANTDVHSSRAPLVPNPAWRLFWALNTLKDRDERILVAGWYDDAKPPTDDEMRLLATMPFEEEAQKERLGLEEFLLTRSGADALRHLYFSPTCTICGLEAGYTGVGLKTVLPCRATAKVGFRLPHALNPDVLYPKLRDHLRRHGFGDIQVTKLAGYEPSKTPAEHPFVRFVVENLREVYGEEPVVWPMSAGTSPRYTISNWMDIPVVSAGGAGYPDSRAHAPNENIRISDYIRSIKFNASLIASYN